MNTVRAAPVWGDIHPPGLSVVLTSLLGTSWTIGQVWSSDLSQLVFTHWLFALFPSCSNLANLLLCPYRMSLPNDILLAFFLVLFFLSLSSLTFPSILVIFYLALMKATGMKAGLYDTWLRLCFSWFVVSLRLFAAVNASQSWVSHQCLSCQREVKGEFSTLPLIQGVSIVFIFVKAF